MKTPYPKRLIRLALLVLPFILAIAASLHAQSTFSAAQLANLQPLDPETVPRFGTFFLLKSPDPNHGYPPLPCPPGDLPGLPIFDLGDGQYLVDDSQVDYAALREEQVLDRALRILERQSSVGGGPPAPGNGDGGEGGDPGQSYSPLVYSASDLWLELLVTNSLASFIIHTPDIAAYDLFGTTNLSANVPGLNLTNWVWLLRTEVGQTNNIILTNLWPEVGFFRLGTMLDSNSDGVTDAYSNLVGQNSNLDLDGDGVSDIEEMREGRNPMIPGAVADMNGVARLDVFTVLR